MTNAATALPQESATTCVIGCKLPHGLVCELTNSNKETIRYTLKGANSARIIGGYGLTEGVPRDFFEQWLRKNSKHPAVVQGSVFMHTSTASAIDHAKDNRKVLTGLEPINPLVEASRRGLEMDDEDKRAYLKQVAENPDRNRQIVE